MTRWTYRAALVIAAAATYGPLWAQTEVPAIINTYRANPLQAAGITRTHGAATFSLTADQVRELTYRCYIAGTMQGVPDATGTFGMNLAAQPYPVTAPQLTSSERMPSMPLVRRAGPDGLYGTNDDELILYVELRKLPLQATCDKVVENLRNLGLASKLDGAKPMSFDAASTGNWRLLIHPPAGKGAPPAPGVYYPEAIGAVTPGMTKAQADAAFTTTPNVNVFREFWGRRAGGGSPSNSLEFRYTGWGDWVRNAWMPGNLACHVPASAANGIIPMPFFVANPNFADVAEKATGVDRTLAGGAADLQICRGNQFFDPNAMWENRRLDADGTIVDPAADLTNALDWFKRRPAELAETDAPASRPIEVLFRFAAAADPGAANWYLRGIHSTAETTDASVDATMVLPTAGTLNTTNGFGYYPAPVNAPVVEVNLLNGQYRLSGTAAWLGTAVRRPAYAGVGMVELQFEYETGVPVEEANDLNHTQWKGTVTDSGIPANDGGPWPFGWDDRPGGNDDAAAVASWNLAGPDAAKGTTDDQVIFAADLPAHVPDKLHVVSGQAAGATYARDPLNVHRNAGVWDAAAAANAWKVRRFCSWPYNGSLLGVTGAYQGGPLVCRYMVSSVQVLPQDADQASSASATLSKLAQYDPANGGLYPQLKTMLPLMSTSGTPRDISQDLERPNFLLGYLPDGGVVNPIEDYFLPVSPGAKSPTLRFYVQTMMDGGAGGGNHVWTAADRLMDGPRDVRKSSPDAYLGYNLNMACASPGASLLYWYDIHRSHNAAGTQTQTTDTQVRDDDDLTVAATVLDQRRAFDGDLTTATTLRDHRWLGRDFDVPSLIDRVELQFAAAPTAADWELAYRDPLTLAWINYGTWTVLGNTLIADGPRNVAAGIRVHNISGADRQVAELRLISVGDLRSQVAQPPAVVTGRAAPDTNIPNASVPASAVRVTGALDRELNVRQDSVTPLDLSVEVPRYQPPSRDAVERQLVADRGLPATPAYNTMVDPRGDWDRYRGSVRLFVDDQRTYANDLQTLEDSSQPSPRLKPRSWDASLYQLQDGSTQFVRWYDERSGDVGRKLVTDANTGQTHYVANLTAKAGGYQHVSVESYAPFDVEFTVGYERRMSIAERLIDFGRAIGGAMSQWVPVTVTNEGNVPLYDVKFYVQDPMRAVQAADGASRARGIQLNPIPSWLSSNLAIGAPAERGLIQMFGGGTLSTVFPAAAGSLVGNTVTDVYLRLGRNDLAMPLRIPVGQPMGNYAGTLGAFVDNLGTQGADCPNDGSDSPDRSAKTAVGGSAVMKATVTESPLARVADFFDNESDRQRESANVLNVAPYDATRAQPGTFQPVPDLQFYSEPDVADATPALAVAQDLSTMSNPQPDSTDQLAVFWSRLLDPGGGTNPRWDVWLQRATRPALVAGQVTSTNYRAFDWPAAPLAGNPQGAAPAGTRNVYPSVCAIPGSTGPDYLVLWHNEADKPAENRRASALQFYRYSGTNRGPLLTVADDASGNGLVNKAMPRAVVDTMNGAGLVAWCAWQNGQGGRAKLGFNAISMPTSYNAGAGYADAITVPAGSPVRNYDLQTPPGLTNVAEPWLLPSYRDEASNTAPAGGDPRVGNLRLLNGFYSAWSPLWQNQDIYWTRYRALQDPGESATDNVNSWADGLANSPMAEDGYRLARTGAAGPVTMDYPVAGQTQTLTSLPGGRVPFARITDELLQSTPENTAYGSAHPDWVMPPAQPRLSYCAAASPGVRRVEQVNHKGFADTVLPIVDHDSTGAAVPLVQLRIFPAGSLSAGPPDLSTNPTLLTVNFDLPSAMWDAAQGEWVLAIRNGGGANDAFATLDARGVHAVRIHPGLGRVTFSAPLYKRGQNNPIYVYASYRPATWRMTTDLAGDTQPTAAFDWWERLTLVWRRGLENGRGQLWYRTFSLSVPLDKPPLTATPTAMADVDATPQAMAPTLTANDLRDGMVDLPMTRAGHRVRFTYTYTTDSGTATSTDEYHYVPGLGPERVLPMDGVGSESMPALAAEHFLAGYPLGGNQRSIMSGRHWLAWISTRDLYQLTTAGSPPQRGKAGTHVYYGAFLPDYTPAAEAR